MARALAVLAVLLCAGGCTASQSSSNWSSQRNATPARGTRCLVDPTETGTRPLFFLFCVESP